MRKSTGHNRGFTIIELLVVIAIIGFLSAIILVNLNNARARARDAVRLSDIRSIRTALELYRAKYGVYPTGDGDEDGNWDVGDSTHPFISNPTSNLNEFFGGNPVPVDKKGSKNPAYYDYGYRYYRYTPVVGCGSGGSFYVIMIQKFETVSGPRHPQSPGFSCGGRDWGLESPWVAGEFEN